MLGRVVHPGCPVDSEHGTKKLVPLAGAQNCVMDSFHRTKDTKREKALLIGQLQQFGTQLTEHFKRILNYSIHQLIEFYSSCPSCSSW
jgi:hypothetical protein